MKDNNTEQIKESFADDIFLALENEVMNLDIEQGAKNEVMKMLCKFKDEHIPLMLKP